MPAIHVSTHNIDKPFMLEELLEGGLAQVRDIAGLMEAFQGRMAHREETRGGQVTIQRSAAMYARNYHVLTKWCTIFTCGIIGTIGRITAIIYKKENNMRISACRVLASSQRQCFLNTLPSSGIDIYVAINNSG